MQRAFHSNRLPKKLDADLLAEAPLAPGALDLTESNPTRCHLPERIALSLHEDAIANYRPEALGPQEAREAVAAWHSAHGRPTDAPQVMLTCSTSEALSFIFKLACSPGEAIACAVPGYPLVPHLAELEGLTVQTFPLRQQADGGWLLHVDDVQRALTNGAKTIVLVAPGNPVGCYLPDQALRALRALCNRHEALVVFDEVFASHHASPPYTRLVDVSEFDRALCVGGLSKAALLPQAKVSWITVYGSRGFAAAARAGLEWIGDTFLSVGVTATALPAVLHELPRVQAGLRRRLRQNMAHLQQEAGEHEDIIVDPYTAGWSAVVRPLPHSGLVRRAQRQGRHVADVLLEEAQVQLHPGYLFDLPQPHTLVTSLIVPEDLHRQAWGRVLACVAAMG